MKVFVQERKQVTYDVEPYVTVEYGKFQLKVHKKGLMISFYEPATAWYSTGYLREPIPLEVVRRALDEWEKVK